MTRLIVHTHLPAAAKITFEIEDATKISFHAIGGGDGVPPGLQIQKDSEVMLYVAAQDFGIAIVEDGKVTVESASA